VSNIQSNIWKSYLIHIIGGLAFFVPIIVLFWQENGLTMTKIMVLQSLYSLTIVFLDIPTGYFADKFGRKTSLLFSSLFLFLGIFIYSLGHNFYQFLIAEVLWGTGVSFMSGADSALVYDTLKELKQEEYYKKIWGKLVFYGFIATAVANILGGFIGKIDFRYTFYVMLPFYLLLFPIALSIKEPKRKEVIKKAGIKDIINILKVIYSNPKLKWFLVYSGIVYGFNSASLWLYQPYLQLIGLDIIYFGFVFASFQIIAALASKYSHKIEGYLGQKYSLIILIFLITISYFLMSNFIFLFSFSFAFIQQFVRGFYRVVMTDYVNKLASSDIRATVLSAQNMAGRLFYAAIIPIVGYIVDAYSLLQAITVLGITTLVTGTFILIILHRVKVI